MTPKQAFATAMQLLTSTFAVQLSDDALEGYRMALEDLTADEIGSATRKALRECKFMPRPAELLELAGKGGPRALAAATAEAWDAVMVAKRRHDYTESVDFGPLVNAVLHNIGGWLYLCGLGPDQLVWHRKKFEEVYAAFASKPPGELPRTAPLRGSFGGPVTRIPIGGKWPPLQVEGKRPETADVVRRLAEEKPRNGNPNERSNS